MRFNLEKADLLFEVRHEASKGIYTYEQLYRSDSGELFIHFIGSAYSEYGVRIGYSKYAPREGNYLIDNYDSDIWKKSSENLQAKHPGEYMIIDWEAEQKEALFWIEEIAEEELPF